MSAGIGVPVRREWWTRPKLVLPLAGAIVVLAGLLKPVAQGGRTGDDRLSAHLSGSLGARALSDVAARLGWKVELRDSAAAPPGVPGRTIHAVLAPPLRVTPKEAHAYLQAVRGGDGLLLALGDRSPLSDSLRVWHMPFGMGLIPAPSDTARCERDRALVPPLWPDGETHLYPISWIGAKPAGRVVFAASALAAKGARDSTVFELATGFPYGRGRVVVVADPDLLRNDVLRRCGWGASVAAVRMLEWLRAGGEGPRDAIVFDEYHQGFGRTPSMLAAARGYLVGEPSGRMVLQGVIAALLLLVAMAPRPLAPRDSGREERRDPLEQVDALAHAYEQVGATRTAVSRLLAALRRRRARAGGRRPMADDAFLDDVAQRVPALGDEVATVRSALAAPCDDAGLARAGAALRRIEDTLTTTTS